LAKLRVRVIDKTTPGSSTAILTDVVPALQEILGPNDNDTPGVKSAGAQNHFLFLFCQMVASICTPECPLVLFLDDLQWAEPASIGLLSALVKDTSIRGLFLMGACRGNEVSTDHQLSVSLRELEDTGVRITNIMVGNLHSSAVHQMIYDVLQLTADESKPLADFVFRQTNGNIFFSLMLLRTLFEEGFLYQDDNNKKNAPSSSSSWKWDSDDSILMNINCQDVINMVADKIRSLSAEDQQVLKIAACMGAEFDEYILTETCDCADVGLSLQHAQDKGLVSSSEGGGGEACRGWRFVHDTIQQSAYYLIREADRPAFHLEIGRKLWEALSLDDVELNVFLIVNQLSLGMDLMNDEDERYHMAALCLGAGEKATMSSAFQVAASYLKIGMSLLANRHWRDQYHISLALFNAAAEVEYCNANHDRTDYLVEQVLLHARCFKDKLRSYTTQIYSVGCRSEFAKAIGIGLKVLKELGCAFPSKVNTFHIVASLIKTKRMLKKNKSDQDILDLPRMVDGDHLAVARLLNLLFNYANHASPKLSALICFRNVQLTVGALCVFRRVSESLCVCAEK
jgi:predicted ATPase